MQYGIVDLTHTQTYSRLPSPVFLIYFWGIVIKFLQKFSALQFR